MEERVYVAGRFQPAREARVSVFDHGLLYGDGVFEGIRAYHGRVFKLERHIDRLFESARAIRLAMPMSRPEVVELVLEACRQNDIVDGYIRLVVTRGAGDLGLDPRSCPQPEIVVIARPNWTPARRLSAGARLVTSSFRRVAPDALSPSIKSLNYLNNVLARIEANDRGADEALLLDRDGFVAEATTDNVFIVTDRALVTPPTSTNLNGITRETMLALAASLSIQTQERPFTLFELWTAREAFLCGTAIEVVPVIEADGRPIGTGALGPTTARLMAEFEEHVRSVGTPIHAASDVQTGVGAGAGFRV